MINQQSNDAQQFGIKRKPEEKRQVFNSADYEMDRQKDSNGNK
jgi:hypothetical protein